MSNPNVCVLKTDGVNCDMEMSHAFAVAGAEPETIHINQLRNGDRQLNEFGVLALSGGFSYGDDIASGKVLANELTSYLSDSMQEFVQQGKPVLGVCNGFQVLVRTGLLPRGRMDEQQVTLAENTNGRFECRWIDLAVGASVCRFVRWEDFAGDRLPMQTAHGEGRFFGDGRDIQALEDRGQVVFRYTKPDLRPAQGVFPYNPNGAMGDIAGICDPTGVVLGMMPHPERSVESFHPDRGRTAEARDAANLLFRNIVTYAKEL